jgi:TetR/AcrR family transcriptional regulator, regulator of cefoperazone and chloramphenicol sensitivity
MRASRATTERTRGKMPARALARKAEPQRRDREATKRALLKAGLEVFAARGYDAATTRAVAEAAGVNEQLIQRYFGGKEGLLLAILGSTEQQSACPLPPPAGCVEAEIAAFLEASIEGACSATAFSKVVLSRAIVDPEVAKLMRRHFIETRAPALRERLGKLRDHGLIDKSVDLEAVATGLATLTLGMGFVDRVVLHTDPRCQKAIIGHLAWIIARGLTPGGAPSAHLPQTPSTAHTSPSAVSRRKALSPA